VRRDTHPRQRRRNREVVDDQRRGDERGVAALLGSGPVRRHAHGKGQCEAQQHGTENVARWRKRVRHDDRLRRRTSAAVLTCEDGGELEQRRWHAALDRGRQRGARTRRLEWVHG
jgi:hypothetical protein